jgi:hypothetical protein
MHEKRITYAQLAVLVETNAENSSVFCKKERMEFAACNFHYFLTIEIRLTRVSF